MQAAVPELSTETASFPRGIEVVRLDAVTNEEILEPVMEVFRASQDAWFATLSKPYQERLILSNWFNREETDNEASVVLKEKGMIVGFAAAKMYDGLAEVGPVGVLPQDRGRAFGRAMLLSVIGKLRAKRVESAYIEVSTANKAAE